MKLSATILLNFLIPLWKEDCIILTFFKWCYPVIRTCWGQMHLRGKLMKFKTCNICHMMLKNSWVSWSLKNSDSHNKLNHGNNNWLAILIIIWKGCSWKLIRRGLTMSTAWISNNFWSNGHIYQMITFFWPSFEEWTWMETQNWISWNSLMHLDL